jgi:hypothetical protein
MVLIHLRFQGCVETGGKLSSLFWGLVLQVSATWVVQRVSVAIRPFPNRPRGVRCPAEVLSSSHDLAETDWKAPALALVMSPASVAAVVLRISV